MELETLVQVISRWAHVGTAIVLLGGSVFLRFVVLPAAQALPETEHAQLRERIMARWKKIVMAGITLLLVTGFYNYYLRMQQPVKPQYHMLMGIKILLAFGVFFLASALTGRSAGLAAIRRDASRWLGVLIGLAAITVAIAGYLKVAYPAGV
jgi:uncharacterized membrane protein